MLKALSEIQLEKPLVSETGLSDYKLSIDKKKKLADTLGSIGYGFDAYTSYAITDKAREDKPANYAVIPNQYFVFACKMYDFATELHKYFDIYEKVRTKASSLVGDAEYIAKKIRTDLEIKKEFSSEDDIELFAKFLDKDNSAFRLGSKRLINDEGTPRGSRDCFGSVILKEINLPDASSAVFGRLVYDLCENPNVYSELCEYYATSSSISKTVTSLNMSIQTSKPFLLLAGISGTGKTRFVREQAKASGQFNETYCLTSVRPDWHEPSDLLGYISRLNGKPEYITTDVLQFIAKAWRAIVDAGLIIETQMIEKRGEHLVVTGERAELNAVLPYWLCLDEMNLAPVEQYFADYLSVLETREWHWDGDSFRYTCDPLLKRATIAEVDNSLRAALGFNEPQYDAVWELICRHGLSIPFNLMVAGTVNMDETTHGFSRKVIDRALTFDFGEFFPNDFSQYLKPEYSNKKLSYPLWSDAKASICLLDNTDDPNGAKTIAFLSSVNTVLKSTPFELAYRALNELLLAVMCVQPQDNLTLKAVWDDFLMCKVLPRIEGDDDKLSTDSGDVLSQLLSVLETELLEIWDKPRPDLLRENIANPSQVIQIACRSRKKIEWMQKQLNNGFTSFWP